MGQLECSCKMTVFGGEPHTKAKVQTLTRTHTHTHYLTSGMQERTLTPVLIIRTILIKPEPADGRLGVRDRKLMRGCAVEQRGFRPSLVGPAKSFLVELTVNYDRAEMEPNSISSVS